MSNVVENLSILRKPEVLSKTGLKTSQMYALIQRGHFPAPIKLGGPNARAAGWLQHEVEDWIRTQIQLSRRG